MPNTEFIIVFQTFPQSFFFDFFIFNLLEQLCFFFFLVSILDLKTGYYLFFFYLLTCKLNSISSRFGLSVVAQIALSNFHQQPPRQGSYTSLQDHCNKSSTFLSASCVFKLQLIPCKLPYFSSQPLSNYSSLHIHQESWLTK